MLLKLMKRANANLSAHYGIFTKALKLIIRNKNEL